MKPEEPTRAGLALGDATAGLDAHRFAHEAMAAVFEVICAHDDSGYARQAAQAAFDLVDRLELEQSRFIVNSDVSRINNLARGEGTRVSPSTMECLEIARRMHTLTGRAFDISIGSGLQSLDLVPDELVVRAQADGIRLDLGGIGKGYEVDRMADLLDEWDVPRALIHGGFSSVLARDAPPVREGWPLTLTAPGPGDDGARIRIFGAARGLQRVGHAEGGPHPGSAGKPTGPRASRLGGPVLPRRDGSGRERRMARRRAVAGGRCGGPLDRVPDPARRGARGAVSKRPATRGLDHPGDAGRRKGGAGPVHLTGSPARCGRHEKGLF